MGKTFSTGLLTNGIWQDASNNIGIGGSPSGSYKFEVTGNLLANGTMTLGNDGTYGSTYKTLGLTGNTNGTHRILAGTADDLYIAAATSRGITFLTNGTNTARMTILSSGNVGIGTTSPVGPLMIAAPATGSAIVANSSQTAFDYSRLRIKHYTDSNLGLSIGYAGANWTYIQTGYNEGSVSPMLLNPFGGSVTIGNNSADWYFNVKASTGGYLLNSNNTRNVSGDVNALFQLGNNCNNTSSYFLVCALQSGDRMYIYGNGNIVNTNNSYGVLSDIKLKENIVDATPKLENLLKVKIRNYNLIGEETKQIGVVAQELEEIFPSMIEEKEDFKEVEFVDEEGNIKKERQSLGTTTKSVKMSVFVPMLIKAVQELSAKVSALENKA